MDDAKLLSGITDTVFSLTAQNCKLENCQDTLRVCKCGSQQWPLKYFSFPRYGDFLELSLSSLKFWRYDHFGEKQPQIDVKNCSIYKKKENTDVVGFNLGSWLHRISFFVYMKLFKLNSIYLKHRSCESCASLKYRFLLWIGLQSVHS